MRYPLPRKTKLFLKACFGGPALRCLWNPGDVTCLSYHRVVTQDPNEVGFAPNLSLGVKAEEFAKQLQLLTSHFHCLSLPDALQRWKDGTLPARAAVITFDDGYRDNLTHALPLLEQFGVPATIYVTTGLVDRAYEPWWYEHEFILRRMGSLALEWRNVSYHWQLQTVPEKNKASDDLHFLFKRMNLEEQQEFMRMLRTKCQEPYSSENEFMTWDELRQIEQHPLITIGAHTHNHPVLSRLTPTALQAEFALCRDRLRKELKKAVQVLAYPFGSFEDADEREFKAAEAAGFSCAVTTRLGHWRSAHRNNLFSLPRVLVEYSDTIADFRWRVSGLEERFRLPR